MDVFNDLYRSAVLTRARVPGLGSGLAVSISRSPQRPSLTGLISKEVEHSQLPPLANTAYALKKTPNLTRSQRLGKPSSEFTRQETTDNDLFGSASVRIDDIASNVLP